jgi:hypothetical protein
MAVVSESVLASESEAVRHVTCLTSLTLALHGEEGLNVNRQTGRQEKESSKD